MQKILITNTNVSWNKGSAAQVISVVCNLRKFVPEVTFTLLSYCSELDLKWCSKYGIRVVGYTSKRYHNKRTMLTLYSIRLLLALLYCALCSLLRAMNLNTKNITQHHKYTKAYVEADLILDLSGDSFTNWQAHHGIINALAVLPALLLKKPVVFFSQSIGPFNCWTLPVARFCLNNSNLVVIREDITKHYLEHIGVNERRLYLAADCAFLLDPIPVTGALRISQENGIAGRDLPLIGISVSGLMMENARANPVNDYLLVMSRLVDYIIESKNAYVALISHVVAPREWGHDDRYAVRGVYRLLKNKRNVTIIEKDYGPRELKGIIGKCDLFIGCRMHANIAALSQGIPTIAIGWSHKYYGIMKRLGMEEYVWDFNSKGFEELKFKVDMLFSLREKIQNQLIHKIKNEKRSALRAVKLVSNLVLLLATLGKQNRMKTLKKEGKTIQEVVKQGLCTGCGTCIAICPKNALTVTESSESGTYLPMLNDAKCNQCGVCLRICPGAKIDYNELNLFAFNKEPKNSLIGNYSNCYVGCATDRKLRYKSASGGLVTALSTFALETGDVNGVLVTRMRCETPLRPESFIAKTREEIMSATGSKYCPVSANISLKEIIEKKGCFIVVGLPCHIQGLRKAQVLNKELRNNVSYCFGLVCNHTPSFHATRYLLRKFKIPEEKIVKLDYRGTGWPGGMKIVLDDGSDAFIPQFSSYYWGFVFQRFFWPRRCMVCDDKLCQLADITFMDAWLPQFSSDNIGTSLVIVRSKRGEKFLEKAMKHKVITLQATSIKSVTNAQSMVTIMRKVVARRFISQLLFKSRFPFSKSTGKPTFLDLLDAFYFIFMNMLCQNASKFSQLVIEYHVTFWNLARSIKKILGGSPKSDLT